MKRSLLFTLAVLLLAVIVPRQTTAFPDADATTVDDYDRVHPVTSVTIETADLVDFPLSPAMDADVDVATPNLGAFSPRTRVRAVNFDNAHQNSTLGISNQPAYQTVGIDVRSNVYGLNEPAYYYAKFDSRRAFSRRARSLEATTNGLNRVDFQNCHVLSEVYVA